MMATNYVEEQDAEEEVNRDNECIVCHSPSFEASSSCCQQPIHYQCIDTWFQSQLQTVSFADLYCPYCRTKINSFEFDRLALRYKERMDERPYNEDRVFMRAVQAAWGNRPFWRENNGNFYGIMRNTHTGLEDEIFLGANKEQALHRMRAITTHLENHAENVWDHLCNVQYAYY